MDMEEIPDDGGFLENRYPNTSWWRSEFAEKLGSVSLDGKQEILRNRELTEREYDRLSSQIASQIFWNTGTLSEPIPNGFYSVVPEKRLKECFEDIPTLDDLHALELEGLGADVILVDAKKDKRLSMLKQLIVTQLKSCSNDKKDSWIVVADVYKRPNSELSHAKASLEEASQISENKGVQLLGQIKHSSSRPRAILFKLLADTVGLESQLVVGLPAEAASECAESDKHMSILVVLNSVELFVDLIRFPGQLIPRTTKSIYLTHIAAGESDSAENDSCDSPLEPNSPLYEFSKRNDTDSSEKDDILQNMMLRSHTSIDRKLSLSQSEPNTATIWRRGRRKVITEPRTASSSPEHPSFRAHVWSMLCGDNKTSRGYSDDVSTSRSEGAPTSEVRRIRRSISITPEIGDDIARAVRAMTEALKQNRLLKEQGENSSYHHTSNKKDGASDLKKDMSSQRAMSLPSSPHELRRQVPERSGPDRKDDELVLTWNRIQESHMYQNKPLLPFEEWNIDFSELTVGTRVGIEVFRGMWNGTEVAIKVFLEQDLSAENMEDFCNEISILSRARHPNVILFLGACAKPPHLSMVTEYMEMGSLYHLIHVSGHKNRLSWPKRLNMLRDICRGLMCLHRMKIVHRDLKSANCLVNKRWTVKICDFGLSRIMTDASMRNSTSAGTPEWMAPELIRNEPFTEKCDIFSFGVIMWELYTLHRPWEGVPPERVIYAVANQGSRLELPEGPLGSLIADCWAEPNKRPSCEEILTRLLSNELSLYYK
ncbi:dual specificity protein kinase splB isoform X2 [Capsicum chacoense]